MKRLICACVIAAVLVPTTVQARRKKEKTGVELGARLGYAIPMGEIEDVSGQKLGDYLLGQVPVWLDVGYRASKTAYVGAYASLGYGRPAANLREDCDDANFDCSVYDLRLGFQTMFHLEPREKVDPWLGAHIGYEALSVSRERSDREFNRTYSGWDFGIQGGIDFAIHRRFVLGPVVGFSISQYGATSTQCDFRCPGGTGADEIGDTDLHHWLFLGMRGAAGFW